MDELKYPIGKYKPEHFSEQLKLTWLNDILIMPLFAEEALLNLDATQLNTPYREGGWTVQQVIHHLADSHMNAYIRFKLGITEHNPTIKPYDENEWAILDDVSIIPVTVSIVLLKALHTRWYTALRDLPNENWNRTVFHPEHQKTMTLWFLLGMYAWHGKHHVAHITKLKERNNW